MLTKRQSVLDGGLYELSLAANESELMLNESYSAAPAPAQDLDAVGLPSAQAPAFRPRATLPAGDDRVTVKLVAGAADTPRVQGAVADLGGEVISSGPQVLLANVPHLALSRLNEVPGLRRAEQAHRLRLRMDQTRGPVTGADQAAAQHPNLRGQGVVVGIVDSGVDWRHDDFRTDDGATRLEMFLHAQHDGATQTDSFDQFSGAQIDAALTGGLAVPTGDLNGHGTHCASIAAGNGRAAAGQQFRGVAPQATLMGVRTDTLHDTHIIEGIRRIFAEAGARPAVVNLSLGGHMGPHDGTSALENVISRETGPGRIVVVAAGNEAEDRIHFGGELVAGQDLDIEFTIRDEIQFIDVWIARGDEADITLIDHDGNETVPDGSVQQTSAGAFRADLREDQFNRDINLTLVVASNQLARRWRLRLAATAVQQGTVHAWSQTRDPNRSRGIFMNETSQRFSIGMPATEERAISVASVVSRAEIVPGGAPVAGLSVGAVSPFSSRGPARHGAQRPDIAAPGQHVVAALAADSSLATNPSLAGRRLPGGQYISIQGTSMATPFVTGAIALMLQQEPDLAPEDIQLRLRATGTRDAVTGPVWNPTYGYGRIDVQALLNYSVVA